ncbi:hypothetical protein NH340_JMT08317 [Sarcoptes scabiei]|nr:hypothetical protein NH340_JMT08317 [Sarcoptes scabiei]
MILLKNSSTIITTMMIVSEIILILTILINVVESGRKSDRRKSRQQQSSKSNLINQQSSMFQKDWNPFSQSSSSSPSSPSSSSSSLFHHQDHLINHQSSQSSLLLINDDELMEELKPPGHSCDEIRIQLCRDVGYNVTSMPNFVGHELQSDAELQLQSFIPLISYGCSSQLKFFLCSVYVPMCTEKVPVMIGPCRPLCESVRSRCAPVLLELGFPWPQALNCSKFVPENTVDHMCMEGPPPHESEFSSSLSSSSSSSSSSMLDLPSSGNHDLINQNANGNIVMHHHDPHQSSIDQYHQNQILHGSMSVDHMKYPSDLVSRPKQTQLSHQTDSIFSNDPKSINHDPRLFDQSNSNRLDNYLNGLNQNNPLISGPPLTSIQLSNQCNDYRRSENYVFLQHPRERCVAQCGSDIIFSEENKNFVDYWTVVWSTFSIFSCLLTIFVFALAPSKFTYPERAIIYIAFCYAFYSFSYIYRALVGRKTVACYEEGPEQILLVQEGAHNPHCIISFLLLYYFGMAGTLWWLILTTTWALSVACGWSMKKLSEKSQTYHTIAWTLPALQTLTALVTRAVDSDELTGTCYVGNQNDSNLLKFTIIPMSIYLMIGTSILILSFLSFKFNLFKHCHRNDQIDLGVATRIGALCDRNPQDTNDNETDRNSSHHSQSDQSSVVGCGDFCRRLRRNYSYNHQVPCFRVGSSGQTGSGHSLLLPNNNVSNNFCSTVSSTSSFTSSLSGVSNKLSSAINHQHIKNGSNYKNLASNVFHGTNAFENGGPSDFLFNRSAPMNRTNLTSINNNNNNNINENNPQHHHPSLYLGPSSYQSLYAQKMDPNHQINGSLIRSGIFALFFILPSWCVLATFIYEYLLREQWLLRSFASAANYFGIDPNSQTFQHQNSLAQSSQLHSINEYNSNQFISQSSITMESIDSVVRPNFDVFNVRLFMSLVIGIKTGIWILTSKYPITILRCMFSRCIMKKISLNSCDLNQASKAFPNGSRNSRIPNVIFDAQYNEGGRALISSNANALNTTNTNQAVFNHLGSLTTASSNSNVPNDFYRLHSNDHHHHHYHHPNPHTNPIALINDESNGVLGGINETTFPCHNHQVPIATATISTTISSNRTICSDSSKRDRPDLLIDDDRNHNHHHQHHKKQLKNYGPEQQQENRTNFSAKNDSMVEQQSSSKQTEQYFFGFRMNGNETAV